MYIHVGQHFYKNLKQFFIGFEYQVFSDFNVLQYDINKSLCALHSDNELTNHYVLCALHSDNELTNHYALSALHSGNELTNHYAFCALNNDTKYTQPEW